MKRASWLAILIVCSVVIVAAFFGVPSNWIHEQEQANATATLLERARVSVPAPQLPPRPEGVTETVKVPQYVSTKVPYIRCRHLKCRKDYRTLKTKIGETTVERFIGPTTADEERWKAEVKAIQAKYDADLQAEVSRLEGEDKQIQEAENEKKRGRREALADWISILTGIGSLLIAAVALRFEFRRR
jgi:hypothetical protein